jgi:hypothetical protein
MTLSVQFSSYVQHIRNTTFPCSHHASTTFSYFPFGDKFSHCQSGLTTKIGTSAQVFSVSIKIVMATATKNEWQFEKKLMFRYYFIGTCKWITLNQSIQSISAYLFCFINWRTVNYRISPRHANSPEWLVLGLKYSPNHFTLAFGELASSGFPHCC